MDLAQQQDPELPKTYAEALRYLVNRPFLGTSRYRAQHWRAERNGAHEDILAFERAFIRRFRRLQVPMFAHCVVRTDAAQGRLFVQGRTKARPGQSPHNHGKAIDLVHGTKGWEIPKPCWDLIGHVGKEVAASLNIKVVWGGDWEFYDPAHWELADWRNYADRVADDVRAEAELEEVIQGNE